MGICASSENKNDNSNAKQNQNQNNAAPPNQASAQEPTKASPASGAAQKGVGKPMVHQTSNRAVMRSASVAEPPRPCPPDDELNSLFENFMEEKCFKPEVREKMRNDMPNDRKWMLLCQEKYTREAVQDQKDDPVYWKEVLEKEVVPIKTLQSLRVVIGSQGKSWLSHWVDEGGLMALLSILSNDNDDPNFQMDVMRCLKAFMNNMFGLNIILSTPDAVDQIAVTFIGGSDALRMEVIDLLTVIAWLSVEGHRSVMDALKNPLFGRRYKHIVDSLGSGEDIDLKLNVMTFINAVINANDMLDGRVAIRQEFLDLGLMNVIVKTRNWVDMKRAYGNYTKNLKQLIAQFDVFEEAYRSDKRETTLNNLDLSDPDALLTHLKDTVMEDGFTNQFIQVMHSLMTIPADDMLGEVIWNNCQLIVHSATSIVHDEEGVESPELTYEELKQVLEAKQEEDRNASRSKIEELEKTIEEQRVEMHKINMEKASEIDEIKKGLQQTLEGVIKEKSDHELKSTQLQTEVQKLRAEIEQMKKNGVPAADGSIPVGTGVPSESKDGGSSAPATPATPSPDAPAAPPVVGGPPAPPVMGGPPAPPIPGAPPAPAIPGAPPAPAIPGAPPAPGIPGAPPAPGIPGAPPAPGVPGAPPAPGVPGAPMAPSIPLLPPKKVIKPSVKMKVFHWSVVQPREVPSTVWKDLDDERVDLDVEKLEERFAQKVFSKSVSTDSIKEEKKKPEKQVVQLIEPKRSYNINIALARFRMTHNAIRDAMLAMDEKALDMDLVMTLSKIAPTSEELEVVRSYEGDVSQLANVESFFLTLSNIPRLTNRIQLWLFKQQFRSACVDIEYNVKQIEQAGRGLKNGTHLKRVMEIVLAIGNYLNGGTRNGGAYGFKLNTLEKLQNTKSTDNKITLLHFLVEVIQTKYPKNAKFIEEVTPCEGASVIDLTFLEGEVRKIGNNIKMLQTHLDAIPDDKNDRFKPVMSEFIKDAHTKFEDLEKRMQDAIGVVKEIAEGYGEKKMTSEDLIKTFAKFSKNYKKAEADLVKWKEDEERKAKRDKDQAERKRRSAKSIASREEAESKDNNVGSSRDSLNMGHKGKIVDGTLKTLRANDANDIMKMLKHRRRKRGSVTNGNKDSLRRKGVTSQSRQDLLAATMRGALTGKLDKVSENK